MSCKRNESNSTKMAQKDTLKSATSKLPSGCPSSKLPAGWIQKASRSHPDRIYYFNPETGQSVWNISDITTNNKNRPITRSTSKEDLKKKIDSNKIEKSAKSSKNHTNENKKTKDLQKVKSPITPKSSSSTAAKKSDKSLESYITDVKAIQAKGKIEKINESKRSLQSKDISKTDSKLKSNTDKTLKSPSKRKSSVIKKQDSITLQSICKRKDSKIKSSAIPKPIVKDLVSNIINSSNVLVKTIPNKPERFKIPKKSANNSITTTIVPDKVINETINNIKPLDSTKVDTEYVFVDDMEWEAEESCITENSLILPTDIEMFELDGYDSGDVADGLEQCIRVVDTNIYINDLDLVEQIVRKEILAVPWTVIQELDGLKTSNRGQVSLQARQASRWLSQQVKSKRPGIIFQRMSDVSTAAGAQESPDDKILLYCLYLKDLYGDNVSLVTDDTNLATKAQIEEVETYSSNALKEKLDAKPNIEKSSLEPPAKLNTTKLLAISPSKNVEEKLNVSSTNAQDSKIKSRRKSDCEIDCDLVLTCLTHIWHIVTVISQSLCLLCGLEVPEVIQPRYPLEKDQAASVCQNVLQYVNQIGKEYEILISGVYTCENLQCLCNLLNNFKSNMMVFSHEAWKNTPIINQDQLRKFVQKERLKAEDGLKQLIAIRDQIIVCSTRL